MASKVEICSFLMGSNKTNKIIEWMSKNTGDKFIYVIPNLSELEDTEYGDSRILSIGFETPDTEKHGTKREDLYHKLCKGVNIACTHSLYRSVERKHLDKIKEQGYIVVIDEEVNLIDAYHSASTADLLSLLNDGKVKVSEGDGLVTWCADEFHTKQYQSKDHKHHKFYKHIVNEYIYTSRCTTVEKNGETVYTNVFMTSQLTKELISCAKRIIIITYLFQGSILESFLKLKGFEIQRFEDIGIVEQSLESVVRRITLLPYDKKMRGKRLSATWWKNATKEDVQSVTNFIRRTCVKTKFKADEVMWTCSSKRVKGVVNKNVVHYVNPSSYTRDSNGETLWISCSMRATNKYQHKKLAIHCYDRYPHISIATYLQDYKVKVDQDKFAIAEFLQWLFRSNIRTPNGTVTVAIASERMHKLMTSWMNGEIKDEF